MQIRSWKLTIGLVILTLGVVASSGCQVEPQTAISSQTMETVSTADQTTRKHTPTSLPTITSTYSPTTVATIEPTNAPTLAPTVVSSSTLLESMRAKAFSAEDCLAAELPETACTGVRANPDWTPIIREFSGVPMVLVPAGCFMMGTETGLPDEKPIHEVCIDEPFWIDLTETTVTHFAEFLNGQGSTIEDFRHWVNPTGTDEEFTVPVIRENGQWRALAGYLNHPIEGATWFGANDYCAWRNARLPTEAEWEYAARGPDSWLYPWGNEYIVENVVRIRGKTPAVGSKPQAASWVGALDMCSSLFEWTSSLYRPYPYDAEDGREIGPEEDSVSDRAYRGSPWYHAPGMYDNVSATARFNAAPRFSLWYYSIRCARSFDLTE